MGLKLFEYLSVLLLIGGHHEPLFDSNKFVDLFFTGAPIEGDSVHGQVCSFCNDCPLKSVIANGLPFSSFLGGVQRLFDVMLLKNTAQKLMLGIGGKRPRAKSRFLITQPVQEFAAFAQFFQSGFARERHGYAGENIHQLGETFFAYDPMNFR